MPVQRNPHRLERVADLVQREIAIALQRANDAILVRVSVMVVSVSRDLAYADVYISLLEDTPLVINESMTALQNATPYLRSLLKKLRLRIIPELRFFYDHSVAHGFKMRALIDRAIRRSDDHEPSESESVS